MDFPSPIDLPLLNGKLFVWHLAYADVISADGTTVVGVVLVENNGKQSWRSIPQILIDSGIDLTGWEFNLGRDISADGTIVVGDGINPDGNPEGWLADLSNPMLLPGDYDASLVVAQADLDLVLLHWSADATNPPDGWIPNLPRGLVDQNELDDVLLHWGAQQSPPAPAASAAPLPEPRAGWLLLALLLPGSLSRSPFQPTVRTRHSLRGWAAQKTCVQRN